MEEVGDCELRRRRKQDRSRGEGRVYKDEEGGGRKKWKEGEVKKREKKGKNGRGERRSKQKER